MTDRDATEMRCLEEAKLALESGAEATARLGKRVTRVYLENEFPETRVVAEGDRRRGGTWRIAMPIWDASTGATRAGEPMPQFFATLIWSEVLEA